MKGQENKEKLFQQQKHKQKQQIKNKQKQSPSQTISPKNTSIALI